MITWSPKLQARPIPHVQICSNLCLRHVCYCPPGQRKSSGQTLPPWGRAPSGYRKGKNIVPVFAIIPITSSRIFPRTCHLSPLSPLLHWGLSGHLFSSAPSFFPSFVYFLLSGLFPTQWPKKLLQTPNLRFRSSFETLSSSLLF